MEQGETGKNQSLNSIYPNPETFSTQPSTNQNQNPSPQVQENPMKPKKSKIPLIIIVIALLIISGAVYYYYNNNVSSNPPTKYSNTDNWIPASFNGNVSISYKYPPEWKNYSLTSSMPQYDVISIFDPGYGTATGGQSKGANISSANSGASLSGLKPGEQSGVSKLISRDQTVTVGVLTGSILQYQNIVGSFFNRHIVNITEVTFSPPGASKKCVLKIVINDQNTNDIKIYQEIFQQFLTTVQFQ